MLPHSDLNLPAGLEGLADLAQDLRWTVRQTTDKIWELLDAEAWEKTKNPSLILQNVSQARLQEAARDEALVKEISSWQERRSWFLERPAPAELNGQSSVAYFSMEFGLSEALPIYSGGLGMLAGDHLKTASDLAVPITGIGLLYQQGYSASSWRRTALRWRHFLITIRTPCRCSRPGIETDQGCESRSAFREDLLSCASGRPMSAG